MAREPEDLAERRRALGALLAVFRVAAELTQGQVAQTTFCDRSTVAHIEKGRSRGDERFWTIADELCGAVDTAAPHTTALSCQAPPRELRRRSLSRPTLRDRGVS